MDISPYTDSTMKILNALVSRPAKDFNGYGHIKTETHYKNVIIKPSLCDLARTLRHNAAVGVP